MTLQRTTKLQAINSMLATIGEAPVTSLIDNPSQDVAMASHTLDETLREVGSEEWHFNTDKDMQFSPDTNGHIVLPTNVVFADVNFPRQEQYDVTIRGERLYDRKNKTDVFPEPLKLTIRRLLDFEELPEVARRYVMIRAARRFSDRVSASPTLHQFTQRDEFEARAYLEQTEAASLDVNVQHDPWIAYGMRRHA